MPTLNKEQVYDTLLNPLVAQIIAICKEHGISHAMHFEIAHPGEEGLLVTTAIPDGDKKYTQHMAEVVYVMRNGLPKPTLNLTTTHADGSKTLTAVVG